MKYLYDTCDYPITRTDGPYRVVLFGLDDGAAVLSLTAYLSNSVIALVCIHLGLGEDIWLIPFQNITKRLREFYFIGEALYNVSVALTKLTKICMLFLLLRLFPGDNFRLMTKVILLITVIWVMVFCIRLLCTCRPIGLFWHMWDGENHEGTGFDQVGLRSCLAAAVSTSNCSSLLNSDCVCPQLDVILHVQDCGWARCTVKDCLRGTRYMYDACNYPVTPIHDAFPYILSLGIILPIIAVAFRIAGRLMGSRLSFDDVTIVLALATELAVAALALVCYDLGLGTDLWFVPFHNITRILHLYYICESFYIASTALSKIAMLLLFLRLFPDDRFRLATKLLLVFVVLWCIGFFVSVRFRCKPIEYIWTGWDGEHDGVCFDRVAYIWAHAIINMILDVVIIGLPMPTLARLNLSIFKKVGICLIFGVGIVFVSRVFGLTHYQDGILTVPRTTGVSLRRLISVRDFEVWDNPTRDGIVRMASWSLVELPLSITCVCMPGIWAFFHCTYKGLLRRYGSHEEESSGCTPRGPSGLPSPVRARSVITTLQSANREQGNFIMLQEVEPGRADLCGGLDRRP
ncbi:hypothetical protein BDV19DRAFT_388475 [Aspergillus venezuelensis]